MLVNIRKRRKIRQKKDRSFLRRKRSYIYMYTLKPKVKNDWQSLYSKSRSIPFQSRYLRVYSV
jgi:hypothetical protein